MINREFSQNDSSCTRIEFQPLMLFAVVWALATIIHLLSFPFWARTWQGWLVVLMFGLVLARPRSLSRFTFFLCASLANLFRAMPFVPNHVLFEGMVNFTMLISIVWLTFQSVSFSELMTQARNFLRRRYREVIGFGLYLIVMAISENEYLCGGLTGLMLLWFHRVDLGQGAVSAEKSQRYYFQFAPVLRWEMACMYFWAALQKMNHDYFNPEVSAAVKLHTEIARILPFVPAAESFHPLAIWGSLLLEVGIPILLLFTATRWIGVLAALMFHLFLSIHPHPGIYSYSALVYGLILVFFSPAALRHLQIIWREQFVWLRERTMSALKPEHLAIAINAVFFGLVVLFGLNYVFFGESKETFLVNSRIGSFAWFLLAVWLISCYGRAVWQTSRPESKFSLKLPLTPAVVGLVMVVLNGMNPWIGLKTQTSFSMFSNLRTEFESNHFFLKRVNVFEYQDEMVEVVAAEPDILAPRDDPQGIQHFANAGRILPRFELRRLLHQVEGDVTIKLEQEGNQELVRREGDQISHPELFRPPTLAEQKLLWFRRHESWTGPMPCTH